MSQRRRLGVLYICYLSLSDPLVHTQVVAYLRGLAADGHRIHLLTFETTRLTRARRRELRDAVREAGVTWHGLRYHKRPSLPATIYDTLAGASVAALLVRRHRLDAVHARSHIPAAMALILRRMPSLRRTELIFDIRGLMAEEYEDAGRWGRGSIPFRLTKAVERSAIRHSSEIVVLTNRIRQQLFGTESDRVQVIPCCADVDALMTTNGEREAMRSELGLDHAPVMVYVGKFGGWYMAPEMAQFFSVARDEMPGLHFLILTQANPNQIRQELTQRGVDGGFTITSTPPEGLRRYLAASDFGISFIRPTPSKASSSPTKVGEYLGAGLPTVATSGVGDLDALITPEVGALVRDHTDAAYRNVAQHISRLIGDTATRDGCRELARRELSLTTVGIPRYRAVYERLLSE